MQSQRIDWLYYLPEVVLYLDYKIPPATTAVIPSLITAWFQGRQICSISQLFTHSQKCTFMHLDLVVLSQWPSVLLQPSSSWIMHENWAVNDREKEQFWIWHNLFIAFRRFSHLYQECNHFKSDFFQWSTKDVSQKSLQSWEKNMRDETFGKKLLTLDIYIWSSS